MSNHTEAQPATIRFAPQASPVEQEAPWLAPAAVPVAVTGEVEAPPLDTIIPPDLQAMLVPPFKAAEREQNISETVIFFEENISQ